MPFRSLSAVVFVLSSLVATRATAQEDAARAHFATGQARVAEQRFQEAYAEFSAGYELSHRPLFLFNMAECAFHLGRRDDARRDYARYLEIDPNGAMTGTARERLAELGPAPDGSPQRAAAGSPPSRPRVDLAPASVAEPEVWQEGWFWGVIGASAAVIVAAVITGIVLGTMSSEPGCGAGCTIVDFP